MDSSFIVNQTNPRKTKANFNIASLKIHYVLSLAVLCRITVNTYPLGQRREAPEAEDEVVGTLKWATAEPTSAGTSANGQQCGHQQPYSAEWTLEYLECNEMQG